MLLQAVQDADFLRGCVLMKTSEFKVKVCYGLETTSSGCSFTPMFDYLQPIYATKYLQLMWETLLYTPVNDEMFWPRAKEIIVRPLWDF